MPSPTAALTAGMLAILVCLLGSFARGSPIAGTIRLSHLHSASVLTINVPPNDSPSPFDRWLVDVGPNVTVGGLRIVLASPLEDMRVMVHDADVGSMGLLISGSLASAGNVDISRVSSTGPIVAQLRPRVCHASSVTVSNTSLDTARQVSGSSLQCACCAVELSNVTVQDDSSVAALLAVDAAVGFVKQVRLVTANTTSPALLTVTGGSACVDHVTVVANDVSAAASLVRVSVLAAARVFNADIHASVSGNMTRFTALSIMANESDVGGADVHVTGGSPQHVAAIAVNATTTANIIRADVAVSTHLAVDASALEVRAAGVTLANSTFSVANTHGSATAVSATGSDALLARSVVLKVLRASNRSFGMQVASRAAVISNVTATLELTRNTSALVFSAGPGLPSALSASDLRVVGQPGTNPQSVALEGVVVHHALGTVASLVRVHVSTTAFRLAAASVASLSGRGNMTLQVANCTLSAAARANATRSSITHVGTAASNESVVVVALSDSSISNYVASNQSLLVGAGHGSVLAGVFVSIRNCTVGGAASTPTQPLSHVFENGATFWPNPTSCVPLFDCSRGSHSPVYNASRHSCQCRCQDGSIGGSAPLASQCASNWPSWGSHAQHDPSMCVANQSRPHDAWRLTLSATKSLSSPREAPTKSRSKSRSASDVDVSGSAWSGSASASSSESASAASHSMTASAVRPRTPSASPRRSRTPTRNTPSYSESESESSTPSLSASVSEGTASLSRSGESLSTTRTVQLPGTRTTSFSLTHEVTVSGSRWPTATVSAGSSTQSGQRTVSVTITPPPTKSISHTASSSASESASVTPPAPLPVREVLSVEARCRCAGELLQLLRTQLPPEARPQLLHSDCSESAGNSSEWANSTGVVRLTLASHVPAANITAALAAANGACADAFVLLAATDVNNAPPPAGYRSVALIFIPAALLGLGILAAVVMMLLRWRGVGVEARQKKFQDMLTSPIHSDDEDDADAGGAVSVPMVPRYSDDGSVASPGGRQRVGSMMVDMSRPQALSVGPVVPGSLGRNGPRRMTVVPNGGIL